MIGDLIKLFVLISKLIVKGIKYSLKGIGWYLSNLGSIFNNYPKKSLDKVTIKEEIL